MPWWVWLLAGIGVGCGALLATFWIGVGRSINRDRSVRKVIRHHHSDQS